MIRTYVITGAASGIGKATAELLVERGQRVIGVGILMPLRLGRDAANVATASILVLFGGFVLRVVVLLSSEGIYVAGTQVLR